MIPGKEDGYLSSKELGIQTIKVFKAPIVMVVGSYLRQ